MMSTEDPIVRKDGPAKFHIEIKSDWPLICFTFTTKSPGCVLSGLKISAGILWNLENKNLRN